MSDRDFHGMQRNSTGGIFSLDSQLMRRVILLINNYPGDIWVQDTDTLQTSPLDPVKFNKMFPKGWLLYQRLVQPENQRR